MKKRGQGLPITTIIIAALALIVLVVIIFIFSGKIRVFGGEMVSCTSKGGVCAKECTFGYQSEITGTDCPKGQKCCLAILRAPAGSPCANNDDCAKGLVCKNNVCTAKSGTTIPGALGPND